MKNENELDNESDYPEPISSFAEGQWWVNELDKMAASIGATDEQKRSVAVVHHMLKSAKAISEKMP